MYTRITKLSAGALAVALLLGSTAVAFAREDIGVDASLKVKLDDNRGRDKGMDDNAQSSTTRAAARGEIKLKHAEAKIEIKARLDDKRKENVKRVVDNRIRAYNKHINQLSTRVTRLEVIANKATTTASTTASLSLLAQAKVKLTHASTTLASINANASTTVSASNPGQALQSVKAQFDTVNDDIKAAHKLISDAIKSLKGVGLKAKVESHGTTTTN
jgi:hypothetical protein